MPTKAKNAGSTLGLEFYDNVSAETTHPLAPVVFYDDFVTTTGIGVATNGAIWATKITGAAPPTVATVADTVNGIAACTLTSADQKQEAGLYFGDQRCFKAGQGLNFEARVCVSVTPTVLADICWGLCSDYVEDIDSTASHAVFKVDGSTAVVAESDTGSVDVDDTATGIVAGTTTWHVYRIDASDAADVKFYVDGDRVASATTFAVAAATLLQPYIYAYKLSGLGVGTVQVDYVRVWQARS